MISEIRFLCVACIQACTVFFLVIADQTTQQGGLNVPKQVHIGFGKTTNDMIVMWSTVMNDSSVVEYHTGDNSVDSVSSASGSTVYFPENSNGLQYLHRVMLTNLRPGVKYFYNVRGEKRDSLSDQFSFTTPESNGKQTFMIFGDMGTMTKSLPFIVYEATGKTKYASIFHLGDIAYDLGRENGAVGDKFFSKVERMAARIPYMTIPGDHEMFQNSRNHYFHRLSNPGKDWPMQQEDLWYSMNIGKTHFICISTEVFFTNKQNIQKIMDWLVQDLEEANTHRQKYPWIIVMAHRPLYCSTDDKNEDCTKAHSVVRTHLEDMFYFYGVDLVFSGHQHMYERTWPVYKNRVLAYNYLDPRGTVHIVIGNMGNVYLTEKGSKPGGAWSSFISPSEHEMYGRLHVHNNTHIYWEVLGAQDNDLYDSRWIIQRIHGPFNKSSIFIPDPLGAAGAAWREQQEDDSNDIISLRFFYMNGDDYSHRITVLTFTVIILLFGLCFKKKILNVIRLCFVKQESLPK